MTTESCTSTSQMTTWNVRAMCPNLKNNNEHLLVDCWEVSSSSAPEWTRTFSFMLDGYLYFRISAYAALKMNVGIRWYNESYTSLCHNVTQVVSDHLQEKSLASLAAINRFGKKNSFHFNNEIEKLTHWFNFWTSVILSVRLNDDNHYTFSIFT